jgi:hypothetical protein
VYIEKNNQKCYNILMIRDGKPYLPPYPICPAERGGDQFDLTPERFYFIFTDEVTDETSERPISYTSGGFYKRTPEGTPIDYVHAGDNIESPDSDLSTKARALDQSLDMRVQQRMGEIFCQRIMECRGITETGECHALGSQAVAEVVNQVIDEMGIEPTDPLQ